MGPSDAALAAAWRNRFISERMNAYPNDSHEVCRTKAEADANDFEDAFIAAIAKCTPPTQPGDAVAWYTDDHLKDRSATTYDPAVAERWRNKGWPVTPLYAAIAAMPASGEGDTARLDWLSENFLFADFDYGGRGECILGIDWPKGLAVSASLRLNVDAAIRVDAARGEG